MDTLVLVMETSQMINMIALECNLNTDWPSGKFSMAWKKIKKWFGTGDDVVNMDMDEDLHKIKLDKRKNPISTL